MLQKKLHKLFGPQQLFDLVFHNFDLSGETLILKAFQQAIVQGTPYMFAPLFTFLKFLAPFQLSSKTNYTSIESSILELFESGKKLGLAPSWAKPHPPD